MTDTSKESAPHDTQPHIATGKCGFDRNGSHSAGHYVCTCGWGDKTHPAFPFASDAQPTPRLPRPPDSDIPYHCHIHGWWSAIKESGCPTCISESRRRIRELESALAQKEAELAAAKEKITFEQSMWKAEKKLREQAEQRLAAVESERAGIVERCAKVCEERIGTGHPKDRLEIMMRDDEARDCAAAIRSLRPAQSEANGDSQAAEEDAERYRWLRDNAMRVDWADSFDGGWTSYCRVDRCQMDKDIDAARARGRGEG